MTLYVYIVVRLFSFVTLANVLYGRRQDGTILLFGGMMVALAIERWNLHKRVALKVLLFVGPKPRW